MMVNRAIGAQLSDADCKETNPIRPSYSSRQLV